MKKRDVRLTTESHRPAFDAFAEAMQDASRREGWRSSETLRHFLEAGYRAIRGRLLAGAAFDANEAEYMKIVKTCRHPSETMRDLSTMLGALASALQRDPVDFVGPVFSVLSSSDEMGQFFTPWELSLTIARMTLGDRPLDLARGRPYITLSEPACGVGGMVLAANVVLRDAGVDVARQAHWHMVDVDHRAVCGAYLQVALTDASAIVVHGNTLALSAWSVTPTPAAVLFPKSFDLPSNPVEKINMPGSDPGIEPVPASADGAQLRLF